MPEVGLFLALPSVLGAGLVPAALDCCVGGRKGRGGRGGGVTTPDMVNYCIVTHDNTIVVASLSHVTTANHHIRY